MKMLKIEVGILEILKVEAGILKLCKIEVCILEMLKMRRCTLDMLGIPEHRSCTVMMTMTTVVLIIMNMIHDINDNKKNSLSSDKNGFQYVLSLRTLPFLPLALEEQECQRQRKL